MYRSICWYCRCTVSEWTMRGLHVSCTDCTKKGLS